MADSIARREKVQVNCQTNWILSTVQFKTNDNQFELRTTPKKGNRGSCCYFLDHFPDHFQSSCFFFYLFSSCVFARLRFSPNWFVGLSTDRINISVSDVIVCWVFCHRVSWPVDRHTHHDHLVFVFLPKRRWKPSPKTKPTGTPDIGFWIRGESTRQFCYFGLHCHLRFYVIRDFREKERELNILCSQSWLIFQQQFQVKTKETKMSSKLWWIVMTVLVSWVVACLTVFSVLLWFLRGKKVNSVLFGSLSKFMIFTDTKRVANLCIW